MRRMAATQRRQERESRQRQKELEKRRKEMAKLSELDQARLEVESFENELDVLVSMHKDCRDPIDWLALATALPPHAPMKLARRQLAAAFRQSLSPGAPPSTEEESAPRDDEALHASAQAHHAEHLAEVARLRELANGILAGTLRSYSEAIQELSPFAEIDQLGSAMNFVVHTAHLVECTLTVNGQHVIPRQEKFLTKSGKLSAKTMAKARYHEIYQDHVCSSVLRVARELFALLPLRTVLATAIIDDVDPATGQSHGIPVLSVCFTPETLARIHFDRLDPSDSMANFFHVGDVLASKRTGTFTRIEPLTPADLPAGYSTADTQLSTLIAHAQNLRHEIASVAGGIKLLTPTVDSAAL